MMKRSLSRKWSKRSHAKLIRENARIRSRMSYRHMVSSLVRTPKIIKLEVTHHYGLMDLSEDIKWIEKESAMKFVELLLDNGLIEFRTDHRCFDYHYGYRNSVTVTANMYVVSPGDIAL